MRKLLLGIIALLFLFIFVQRCNNKKSNTTSFKQNTELIQLQLQNVGKLIVTEGHYSQVFTYKDSQSRFFDMISFRKKALVVVNAKVTVGYDLSKLETHIDEDTQTVYINYIPEPEINIYPTIEYYDVTQDYFNQFTAQDFNKIKSKVDLMMHDKINRSDLKDNAQNRLISELQKFYFLTNTMGWTLKYNNNEIKTPEGFFDFFIEAKR